MIHKTITLALRFKGCPFLCFNLFELTELLVNAWTNKELILILLVALWIPALKLGVFIYLTFGVKVKHLFPTKHVKQVLYTLFTIAVTSASLSLIEKIKHGYDLHHVAILIMVYAFILYMDYLETKEVIHKLTEEADHDK